MVESVVSPAGGVVVVSLGGGSVIVTPVANEAEPRSAEVPGTTAISAAFTPTLLVAGISGDELWVWDAESAGPIVRAPVTGDARVVVWIQGMATPTLLVGRAGEPARLFQFDGGLIEGGTVDVVHVVTAALSVPDEGFSSLFVADDAGALWLCRVDATTGELGRQRRLPTELKQITGLAATRGLLGAMGDGRVGIWETDGPGTATIALDDRPSQVVLLRSRSGNPALAWIDQTGAAMVAGVDLARTEGRSDALRLSSDEPLAPGALDLLDFTAYARPISILIANPETATPFVMAIDGAWGTGKTSLGLMVDAELPRTSSVGGDEIGCETLWFNAWMHDDAEKLASAMASVISARLQTLRPWWRRLVSPSPTAVTSFARRSTRVVSTLAVIVAGLLLLVEPTWLDNLLAKAGIERGATLFSLGGISVTAGVLRFVGLVRSRFSDALGAFVRASTQSATEGRMAEVRAGLGRRIEEAAAPIPDANRPSAIPGFDRFRRFVRDARPRRPLRAIQGLTRQLLAVRHERRIVLFIDDLDRCRPKRAIEVCETLSQLLDHPRLIAVVMVDLDALAADAEVVFDELAEHTVPGGTGWGRRFLDKIFQFEFTIPVHRRASLWNVLRESMGADRAVVPPKDPSSSTALGAGLASLPPIGVDEPERGSSDPWSVWSPGGLGFADPTLAAAMRNLPQSFPSTRSTDWPDLSPAISPVVLIVISFLLDSSAPRWLKIVAVGILLVAGAWASARAIGDRSYARRGAFPGVSRLRSASGTSSPAETGAEEKGREASPHGASPQGGGQTVDNQRQASVAVERRDEIRAVLHEGDHLDLGHREAERWLGGASPRTAKRLANRMLFTLAVATDRELLWTASPLDGQVIGRWVTLVELWPTVAGAIRRDPLTAGRLEAVASDDETAAFRDAVATMGVTGPDVLVLREMLLATPRLSAHSDALIRLAQ